ncbi:hypothetical protein NDU88_000798 [Pleurodeles waltl]|uniref:Uncharacterized protein n=1 Tax=Pleurodeles waltl TaxID=8319 RepID=A0AAV7V9F2_PLEWA|nr:hypothetical protein NDU88_000798 [Pleurodeles waltl]
MDYLRGEQSETRAARRSRLTGPTLPCRPKALHHGVACFHFTERRNERNWKWQTLEDCFDRQNRIHTEAANKTKAGKLKGAHQDTVSTSVIPHSLERGRSKNTRGASVNVALEEAPPEKSERGSDKDDDEAVIHVVHSLFAVRPTSHRQAQLPKCQILMGQHEVVAVVDTGASINLLAAEEHCRMSPTPALTKTNVKVVTYHCTAILWIPSTEINPHSLLPKSELLPRKQGPLELSDGGSERLGLLRAEGEM